MSQPFPDLSIITSPNNPVIKSPFVPYQLEFYHLDLIRIISSS